MTAFFSLAASSSVHGRWHTAANQFRNPPGSMRLGEERHTASLWAFNRHAAQGLAGDLVPQFQNYNRSRTCCRFLGETASSGWSD